MFLNFIAKLVFKIAILSLFLIYFRYVHTSIQPTIVKNWPSTIQFGE